MRPRSLLALFLVVAGLGAFVWFYERDLPSSDERAERAKKVLPFEPESVSAMTIQARDQVVRLARAAAADGEDGSREEADGGGAADADWRIVEPLEARADREEINSVLRRLTDLEKERTLADYDSEQLGLDAPGLAVTLTAGGKDWVLKVGEEVPATSNVIAAVEGVGEAYVVAGAFRRDLEKQPGEWRSKRAFPFDRKEITRLELTGGAEKVVLVREGEDFRLDAPLSDEADKDKVSDLLVALTGLEIETFLDQAPALEELGLDPAAVAIRARVGEEDREVRLGSPAAAEAEGEDADEQLLYAWSEGQVFETETELARLAASPASEWRSLAWTRFETFEIDKFEARSEDGDLVLERSEGDWLRGGEKIAYTTASDVLYAVGDVEAEQVGEPTSMEPGDELLEIELWSQDGGETLRLYPEEGGLYPAVREGRDAVLMLSRESVDDLRAKLRAARDAEPLADPADEAAADE